MRITDLLKPQSILLGGQAADKAGAIDTLIDLQAAGGHLADKAAYKEAILAREAQSSTAIEAGIAVPHAKSDAVSNPGLAAMTLSQGVDYGAMDKQPSDLFFMIAAPLDGNLHLEILSRLMVLLMDPEFTSGLRAAKTAEEFLAVIDKAEAAKYGETGVPGVESVDTAEEAAAKAARNAGGEYRVLAVTACPTGIAHTYMAAEALEKAGKALNITVKVETNGSGGVKNALTAEEIAAADGIIVAADKNVETARFNGKPVIFVPVSDGIHKAEELVKKAAEGSAPVYHHQGGAETVETASAVKESLGRKTYKDLMNGVSHMLPFVVGGGILIALAFLFDDFSIDPSNFGMNTPLAAFFKTVGNAAFSYMLPILSAYIAMSIADRPGLAVGFVGGVLAMNGTSFSGLLEGSTTGISGGFLAALLAGFVAGYLVKFLENITEHLPRSVDGIRPMLIYPLGGMLVMGVVMCAINPIMGLINETIAAWLNTMGGTSKILLGAVCGGMMSIDMGGPFNKAAYVFGTAALSSGTYDVMAAVMVGGMVPPIAIALSTTFCPKKWTSEERKNGFVNYIMGLCFISEGAIPFAATDPLRVLPSCVIGSAVSGALSMLFGCTLRAPHGGIFVFPVVGNAPLYVVALVVGSVVGAVLLSLLKKTVRE